MVTENVIISFQARGTRVVNRDIKQIGKSAKSANRFLGLLRAGLVIFASIRVLSGLTDLIDSFTNLRNKLKLLVTSTDQLNAVQAALIELAIKTRTPLDAVVSLFQRLTRSTLKLNLTFNQLLDITRTINQALIISGATAQEARNGLIQFSQGLAAGALRGDELRSVVEQFPRLADLIGKEFGKTGGELIAFAKQAGNVSIGVLSTTKVIKALQKAAKEINAEFKKLTPTIGQGFTNLQTAITVFLGSLNKASGFSTFFGRTLNFLANNLAKVARAVAVLGVALLTAFSISLVKRLALFILTSPFQAFIVGALAAGAAVAFFGDDLKILAGEATTLTDVVEGIFKNFPETANRAVSAAGNVIRNFATRQKLNFGIIAVAVTLFFRKARLAIINTLNDLANVGTRFVNKFVSSFGGQKIPEIKLFSTKGVKKEIELLKATGRFIVQLRERVTSDSKVAIKGFTDFVLDNARKRTAAREKEEKRRAALQKLLSGRPRGAGAAGLAGGDDDTKGIRKLEKAIETLTRRLSPLINAQFALKRVTKLLNDARAKGIKLLIPSNVLLRRFRREQIGVGNAAAIGAEKQKLLNAAYKDGIINLREFETGSRNVRLESLATSRSFEAGFERAFLKLEDSVTNTAASVEGLLTNAFKAAGDAVVEFARTGKISVDSFFQNLAAQLLRIATNELLASALSGLTGRKPKQGASGIGGVVTGLLRSVFGAFGGTGSGAAAGAGGADVAEGVSDLIQLRHGGSFQIGGRGGVDNNLLSLNGQPVARVSRGEEVSVSPSGSAGGGLTVIQNINTPDADSFNRTRTQNFIRAAAALQNARRRR